MEALLDAVVGVPAPPVEDELDAAAAADCVEMIDVSCAAKLSDDERSMAFFCRLGGRWPYRFGSCGIVAGFQRYGRLLD